jgi:hypothetical protein
MSIRFAAEGLLLGGALALTVAGISCGGDSTAPVTAKRVATIVVPQPLDTIEIGSTITITPQFLAKDGSPVSGQPVTWTSEDTSIATVTQTGAVTAKKLGSTGIDVSSDSVSQRISIVVRPIAVTQITLAATSVTVSEGDSVTLTPPTLIDRTGATVTRPVTYSTDQPAVAGVTANGVLHGYAPGSATITVAVDSVKATIAVTVTPTPAAALHVIPAVADMGVGKLVHTQTTANAANGARLSPRQYTYSIANTSVATVNASGVITGVAPGKTTLTISTNGASTTVPVSVATLQTNGFTIDLRFIGNVSSTLKTAAQQAAARWQTVIKSPLAPYKVVTNPGDCGAGTPAVNETVQNVIIYVQADSIDGPGSTAGEGGPCIIRDPPAAMLTALGTLTVDTADVSYLAQNGSLTDLLTHEMGHILGIGTLWGPLCTTDNTANGPQCFPNTATGIGGSDPRFIGANARAASAELGFTPDSSTGVPIENTGGAGTKDGHWRATVFGHELMTGTLHTGGNPLSLVTIEALADFGYSVVPEAADDFTALNANTPGVFPNASANVLPPGLPLRVTDRVLYPRFVTTRGGRLIPIAPRGGKTQRVQ